MARETAALTDLLAMRRAAFEFAKREHGGCLLHAVLQLKPLNNLPKSINLGLLLRNHLGQAAEKDLAFLGF
jgi:hypothetical protein